MADGGRRVREITGGKKCGEAFAPLLNYMYTGRLEVTLENVYSVLLATHLLHMPGALEQCRAALLRLREPLAPLATPIPPTLQLSSVAAASSSSSASSPISSSAATGTTSTSGPASILRPIPNRLMVGPPLCWSQPPLYATDGIPPHLAQLQPMMIQPPVPPPPPPPPPVISGLTNSQMVDRDSPERRFGRSEIAAGSPTSSYYHQHRKARATSPEATVGLPMPFAAAFNAFARSNAALAEVSSSPAPSSDPSSSPGSPSRGRREEKPEAKAVDSDERECSREKREREQETRLEVPKSRKERMGEQERSRSAGKRKIRFNEVASSSSSSAGVGSGSGNATGAVIYDVACCDGPVRFQRVLNENYSSSSTGHGKKFGSRQALSLSTGSEAPENDENGGPPAAAVASGADHLLLLSQDLPNDPSNAANSQFSGLPDASTGLYTCGYCRHTFKSQYCYRKHAKRHLLPAEISAEAERNRQRHENSRSKREVRLLDLNVQYYPCKICGCKFPSYYFVHKHRKLCHSSMEEALRPGIEGPADQPSQDQPPTNRETS
ncbi:RE1-silencing transcription factor isoform X2 [Prorops nasuta]|uniref:RE1-silencing transcription factor isoform X2 n=1 Tax=Prorops nasuta TaxID=863751 RepID=UPI0034CDB349